MNDERGVVLIIDDDPLARRRIRRLTGQRYRFLEASSAERGLELAWSGRPDCVLLDYLLPDVDGSSLLGQLTTRQEVGGTVALLETGDDALALEAMKAGAFDYLEKDDLSAPVVLGAIDRVLERVALHRLLREQQEDLQTFAHSLAHDLREPLVTMSGYAHLLKDHLRHHADPEVERYLEGAISASRFVSQLVERLLSYVSAGRTDRRFTHVELEEVAHMVLSMLDASVRAARMKVEVRPLPIVWGDRLGLAQLFENLIANAVKYRTRISPHLEISARREGGHWHINFQDNGIGIPPSEQAKIFHPFKRLSREREMAGMGLGLPLCAKVAAQHGGRILVESEVGKGANFIVILPAHRPSLPRELRALEARAPDRNPPSPEPPAPPAFTKLNGFLRPP